MTHITKEGLLQAIEEEFLPHATATLQCILARAAELSAQESKPVDDPLKPLQDWYAALMKSGSLSINASMSMGQIISELRAFVSAAQSGSAQDASPKDDEASSANDRAMAHYDE